MKPACFLFSSGSETPTPHCFFNTDPAPESGSEEQRELQQQLSYLRYVLLLEYPNLPDEWEDEIPSQLNHARRIQSDVKPLKKATRKKQRFQKQTLMLQKYTDHLRHWAVIDGFWGFSEAGINFKFSRLDGQ